jgi:hypothetical protein
MKTVVIAFLIGVFGIGIGPSTAATVTPYSTPGTPNSATYNFTALANADVIGFFVGRSAADTSVLGLSVNGATPTLFGLNNQTSPIGQSFDFGPVTAGSVLSFILVNQTTGIRFSSNPASNPDGLQHVFSTNYTGAGGTIPIGVQISFEDLARFQGSDFDYNDASFVLTNVTIDPAAAMANPLPGAAVLFASGLGILGFAALLRRGRPSSRYSR